VLLLDSGGVSRLAERSPQAAALLRALRRRELWPPLVPSVVLVECLHGQPARDVLTNRLLNSSEVVDHVPERIARRAAVLRAQARHGSAVDALLVALAEPGGTILTSDPDDLGALSEYADGVAIERV
jgi:predicted nucleic acid-binding protein